MLQIILKFNCVNDFDNINHKTLKTNTKTVSNINSKIFKIHIVKIF